MNRREHCDEGKGSEKIIEVIATDDGKPIPDEIVIQPNQILDLRFDGAGRGVVVGTRESFAAQDELQAQGVKRLKQFKETGDVIDLDVGAHLLETAFGKPPDSSSEPPGILRLFDIGKSCYEQYKQAGELSDLEIAIRLLDSVLTKSPENHPIRIDALLILGIAHGKRHQRTAAIEDLDTGIRLLEIALDTIPDGHDAKGFILHNLATLHGNKGLARGSMADQEAAMRWYRLALDATPFDEANPEPRARRLASLGTAHMNRFEWKRALPDFPIALQYLEEALGLSPTDSTLRAQILLQLADLHQTHFDTTKTLADLDVVIRRAQEALRLPQTDTTYKVRCLGRLGIGYLGKYDNMSEDDRLFEDLDTAVQTLQETVDLAPDNYALRSSYLQSLSRAYALRFLARNSWPDYDIAVQKGREAMNDARSPFTHRLFPARNLITLYQGAGRWEDAYEVACAAMTMISLLTPRSLKNSDKQRLLTGIGNLASDAAAAALDAGKSPYEALRLLELGRGIILNSLHESRVDISKLQDQHPQLAAEYTGCRAQLDDAASLTAPANERIQPYHAEQRLLQVVEDIRRQPGFDRFLLPPTEAEMQEAAFRGHIIIVNVSMHRCDALIVHKDWPVTSLRLPLLDDKHVKERGMYTPPQDPELLEWLWDTIAEPVLGELGLLAQATPPSDGRKWPRIWWIPTGPLAKLPLHAAGRHTDNNSCDTVLDRTISSYSSSIQTLIYTRQRLSRPALEASTKVVLVAMPQTAGQRDLVHVDVEISKLQDLCTAIPLTVERPPPMNSEVVAALHNRCDIFHFAGHGYAHPQDPAKSSLLLRDGFLTVESLFNITTGNSSSKSSSPFLAYLSACGTGQVRNAELLDEGMHLISAYQLAGFQHVVGSLWEVNDRSCVDVATTTYEWMMMQNSAGVIDSDAVSEGLHRAVRALRSQWILHNKATGALRRYLDKEENTTRQNRGDNDLPSGDMGVSSESQSERGGAKNRIDADEKDARQVEEDDEKLSPLHWVPYVHFGV